MTLKTQSIGGQLIQEYISVVNIRCHDIITWLSGDVPDFQMERTKKTMLDFFLLELFYCFFEREKQVFSLVWVISTYFNDLIILGAAKFWMVLNQDIQEYPVT